MSGQIKVTIDDEYGFEKSIKRFKRLVDACGIIKEYRSRKDYKKPCVKNKEKREASEKRRAKSKRPSRPRY